MANCNAEAILIFLSSAMNASASIVGPRPFKDVLADRVIYVPMDVPSGLIKKHLREKSDKENQTGWGILYGLGRTTVLFQTIGAPTAVISLERLVASGAREILILGFCGSLDPAYALASPVSITKAYSNEGTSGHYCPGQKIFDVSPDLQKAIENSLNQRGLPFLRGAVVTTDAPYRETPAWLRKMRQRRMDVVDMEASAVFGLARFHRLKAAALMIVSDELFSGRWTTSFSNPGLIKAVQSYFFPFLEKENPW
jgi:purine-nucleoside phosphorylase